MKQAPKIEDYYDEKCPETWSESWDKWYIDFDQWIRATPPLPFSTPSQPLLEVGKPLPRWLKWLNTRKGRVVMMFSIGMEILILIGEKM